MNNVGAYILNFKGSQTIVSISRIKITGLHCILFLEPSQAVVSMDCFYHLVKLTTQNAFFHFISFIHFLFSKKEFELSKR